MKDELLSMQAKLEVFAQDTGEPLSHLEGKCNGLTSPTHNELIAKLEALRSGRTYAEWNKAINKCCDIIRAHKPAPVDLEKLSDTIRPLLVTESGDWHLHKADEIAKAVIQALGMTV